MTEEGKDTPAADAGPETPKKKRRFGKLKRWLLGVALVLVALILALPFIVSMDFVKRRVEAELTATLGSPVHIATHSYSWTQGLSLKGLRIDNPPGFSQAQPAVEMLGLSGDVGLWGLVRGQINATGEISGLNVRVLQRADGSTNLEALLPTPSDPPPGGDPGGGESRSSPFDPSTLRVGFRVTDSEVSFAREGEGEVETLRKLEIEVAKEFADAAAQFSLRATMGADGSIEAKGLATLAGADPSHGTIDLKGVDLSRYHRFLNQLLGPEQQLTTCAGVLSGTLRAEAVAGGSVALTGDLAVAAPRFAGQALGGLRIEELQWSLRPHVRLSKVEDLRTVSFEGFQADLGFLSLEGLSSAVARAATDDRPATGFHVQVDLTKVAALGIDALKDVGGGQVGGVVTLATDWEGMAPPTNLATSWSKWVGATLDLAVDRYAVAGFALEQAVGQLVLRDGVAAFQTKPGTALSKGPVTLSLRAPLAQLGSQDSELTLKWSGGAVAGEAVQVLQYLVPFLAGLSTSSAATLDFRSLASADLTLRGPALPQGGESIGAWLNRMTGKGTVALANGQFTPAPVWGAALQFAGAKSPLTFKDIDSKFRFKQGAVETELARLSERAAKWSLSGTTTLDGRIDYSLDLRGLLAGHRDGAKVLKYLGASAVTAQIGGSLTAPTLKAPPFGQLLTKALRGAAEGAARGALERGLRDLFKKKKRKD